MVVSALLALLAAAPEAGLLDAGLAERGDDPAAQTARQMAQALVAGDLDKLAASSPPGFAFDGRQVWSQADVRAEWTHALERRLLKNVKVGAVEVLGYDEMVQRYGAPPEKWSKFKLNGCRIAIVQLGARPLLVIFRKRGEEWVPLGVSD